MKYSIFNCSYITSIKYILNYNHIMLDLQNLFILHNLIFVPINKSSHFSHP